MLPMDASLTTSSTDFTSSPRSPKRQKFSEDVEMEVLSEPSSSPSTDLQSSSQKSQETSPPLTPLPPAELLISLPSLLLHPPNHHFHARSLCMSLLAIRRCLKIPDLSPDIECRAWTALAELGMIVIGGGFSQMEEHEWARGVENEVEEATTKGLLIARKHPSLRSYCPQLTFLAAQLSLWQQNVKFARTLLRRLLTTFVPNDPPHVVYTTHLQLISHLITPTSSSAAPNNSPFSRVTSDARAALNAIQDLANLAGKNGHERVILLTRVIKLRLLVASGVWDQVEEAVGKAEQRLGIEFSSSNSSSSERGDEGSASPRKGLRLSDINTVNLNSNQSQSQSQGSSPTKPSMKVSSSAAEAQPTSSSAPVYKTFADAFSTSMALHTLIIGVVFYTYVGRASEASVRLSHLHVLLDAGALKFNRNSASSSTSHPYLPSTSVTSEDDREVDLAARGIIQVPLFTSSSGSTATSTAASFPSSSSPSPARACAHTPPLYIQTTHPRLLYVLAYLVSCVAKKDPVGRKPKRKIFAIEGLKAWEKEVRKELVLPAWGTVGDVEEIDVKMAKAKADLMCELIGVSIMRSEFKAAEQTLACLISHLRNSNLFPSFSARVTLHHAHLAHARGDTERAMKCYEVAAELAAERGDEFARVCASAGVVGLKIGKFRSRRCVHAGVSASSRAKTKAEEDGLGEEEDELRMDVDSDNVSGGPSHTANTEEEEWEEIFKMGREVSDACRGMGGTMWSVGSVIEACLTEEILRAKQHLKTALSFTSSAGDNHLRALILALIASHYFHTSTKDALDILGTCENLAAGLGAVVSGGASGTTGTNSKKTDAVGNAPLRMWVGERSLEIHRRNGDMATAKKQEAANRMLRGAVKVNAQAVRGQKRPGGSGS